MPVRKSFEMSDDDKLPDTSVAVHVTRVSPSGNT